MKELITYGELHKLFDYSADTGLFVWRYRSNDDFENGKYGSDWNCRKFNTRFAGKVAGSIGDRGYVKLVIRKKSYKAHRLAWLYTHLRWPVGDIDHINGDRSDNRLSNLRECTRSQNMQNAAASKRSLSGVAGVRFAAREKKWVAALSINGHTTTIGSYSNKEAAIAALAEHKKVLHPFHGEIVTRQAWGKENSNV